MTARSAARAETFQPGHLTRRALASRRHGHNLGYYFQFSKVVLAQILSELGTLCMILCECVCVYSETDLPICIEVGSYSTDTQQKISWQLARF